MSAPKQCNDVLVHFDEATHTYHLEKGGQRVLVPSITQCIRFLDNLSGIDPAVLRIAGNRGRDVHRACELYDKGDLGFVPESIQGYLDSWKRCRDILGPPAAIECIVGSWDLKCAGRLDRVFYSNGVVEIKTGQPSPQHGVQLAGQAYLYFGRRAPRFAAYLHSDGEFIPQRDFVEYTSLGDYATFLSCLALTHWRQKNYSKKGESTW